MKKVIVSILTIVLSIPLFVSTPLANTVSQSYTTGYGSYYFTYNNDLDTFILTLGNLGGVNMKGYCQSLIYEFNDTYSGYLDIHLLSDSIWSNATIITENCYVKGKNSAQHDYSIGFNNVTSIKVTVVLPTLTTNNAWSGNKMALTTNYNITRDLSDIPDMLEDIQTSLGTVDAQTPDMLHSLSNIYGVESASRQILAEIEYSIRGNNSLYVLADDMSEIISNLESIGNLVNKEYYDTGYSNTYEFSRDYYTILSINSQNTGNYEYTHDITYPVPYYTIKPNKNVNIMNNFGSIYMPSGTTYQLIFMTDKSIVGYHIYTSNNNGYTQTWNTDYVGSLILNTITIVNGSGGNRIYLEIPTEMKFIPLWYGNINYYPYELTNITHKDMADRYTRKLDAIVNAIGNMAVNVNNLTVNATGITYNVNNSQVNNSVTTYNTNINQVYNVENNFGTQLDTQLQNYNPDNTSIISRLTASGNIMATVLNGINGIELFTVPISVMLVGIVLLAIVG